MNHSEINPRRSSKRLKGKVPPCPPLLRLPREIRDQIYGFILFSETEPPQDSISIDKACTIKENQGHGSIYYERAAPEFACYGLLETCRQLHVEISEAIEYSNREQGKALSYKLNLVIWGRNLRPTWLWLPAPPKFVKSVVVDMKVLDHSNTVFFGARMRQPHILAQYLLQMLRRFFQNGPRLLKGDGKANQVRARKSYMVLDMLSINLVSMPHYITTDGGKLVRSHNLERMEMNTRNFLWFYLNGLVREGLLFGKTRAVELHHRGSKHAIWDVTAAGDAGQKGMRWESCGWGSNLRITQELVDSGQLQWNKLLDCRPRRRRSKRLAASPKKKRQT